MSETRSCDYCGLPIEGGYAEVGDRRFHDTAEFNCYRQWELDLRSDDENYEQGGDAR